MKSIPSDVMNQIMDELSLPIPNENDLTVPSVSEDLDITIATARRRLEKMARDGKLEKIWGLVNNRHGWIYRPV